MNARKPYRLGIAFSGGGARGFAHLGAIKAIEEAGLKPDILSGVSAGSVVAVMYAAGLTPEQMLNVFADTKFKSLAAFSLGGGGLFKIDKFRKLILKAIAPCKRIEDLKLPVHIGVTDLDNAQWTTFTKGSIGDIMTASCSIPIVFKPVRIAGVNYVDGGVLCNLPSRVLRDQCHRLIGINVSPMLPFAKPNSVIGVAVRTYNLMAKLNQKPDMDVCDLAVEMREISGYQVFNLKQIEKVFNSGYYATRRALRSAGWWGNTDVENLPSQRKNTSELQMPQGLPLQLADSYI